MKDEISKSIIDYYFRKKKEKTIFFFLALIATCKSVFINGIIDTDYNCASNLITKLGLSSYFSPSLVCVNPLPCDGTTDCGLGIICDTSKNQIVSFKLQSKVSSSITAADVNCFLGLDSFTLIGAVLDSSFLNLVSNTKSIYIERGTVPAISSPFNSNINALSINITSQFSSKLKFSYFQNIKNLKIFSLDSYSSYVNIFLESDISNVINLDSIEIISSNLVSFQLLSVTNLTITLGSQFTSSAYNSFFSTFNNIQNLYIKQPVLGATYTLKTFPREINSNSNANLVSFISEVPYDQETSGLIDLSNLPKLTTLSLSKVGTTFHSKYQFPFSKFPSTLKDFTFTGGNLTIDSFDFQIFNNFNSVKLNSNNIVSNLPIFNGKNISNFDLSSNLIKNNIDNSWCHTNLIINNNQLNGTVPTCFSNFFCISSVYNNFLGNSFTPSISNVCGSSTLPSRMKIVGSNTILYGADLGLSSSFILTTPSLAWKPLEISNSYYVENYNTPTNFTVVFSSSTSKAFILSNSDDVPFVKSYGIGGTTDSIPSITMSGAYFGYNTSAIQLYYDDIGCIISSSTFDTITCRVKEFSSFFNGAILKITTLKIDDRKVQFMSNVTLNVNQIPKLCDANSCGYFSDQGTCQINGLCLCDLKWRGQYCQKEAIYVDSVIPSNQYGGEVTINGWFTNNHNNLLIKIDNSECVVTSVTNTKILCNSAAGIGTKVLTITQNDDQIATASYVYNATCPNNCSGNGKCSSLTGECKCGDSFQGLDCSLPFKQCPIATGSLFCNNQKCNNQTGKCLCSSDWVGTDCSTPNHYCSSITPAPTDGNVQVTLWGWFGNLHQDLKVAIGGNSCPIINYDSSTINCTVSPGPEGITSVNITQNQISWYAKDRFQYYSVAVKEKECPNSCSGKGQCDTKSGICLCETNYSGFDCSAYSPEDINQDSSSSPPTTSTTSGTTPKPTPNPSLPPKSTSSINNSSSVISISNEQTNFNLLIIKLVEIDINSKPVFTYTLKDNWKFKSENSNKTIYQFDQQLNNVNNPDNNTWITSTIEEVQKNRIQEFAGAQFLLEKNTIKVSIELVNYTFSNTLNTLQLQIESSIDILEDYKGSNQCNNNATTNISESNLSDLNLNYLKIIKNSKIMYGRFINTVLASGRSTFITSGIIERNNDSLIIGLNLPHSSNIVVDPDFSVLVDKSYKTSCQIDEKKSWVLPVSIVVPCVGVASLIIIGAVVYRKHYLTILLAKDKISLRSLSRKNKDDLYLS